MTIVEFCGENEFIRIEYIFTLTNKVKEKINKRKLFYDEQIKRYVKKQVEQFFFGLKVEKNLLLLYKHDLYNAVMFRLRPFMEKHNVLRVV